MKKILIVEDDSAILDAICIVLQDAGYECITYADGSDLLDDNFDKPDLFILDKLLSGIDGLDICRFLKRNERTKSIPVLITSASPDLEKMIMAAGADAFLEKPFRNSNLRNLVTRLTGDFV